jgi:hypothetical protein
MGHTKRRTHMVGIEKQKEMKSLNVVDVLIVEEQI